eukprot:gene23438-29656_t
MSKAVDEFPLHKTYSLLQSKSDMTACSQADGRLLQLWWTGFVFIFLAGALVMSAALTSLRCCNDGTNECSDDDEDDAAAETSSFDYHKEAAELDAEFFETHEPEEVNGNLYGQITCDSDDLGGDIKFVKNSRGVMQLHEIEDPMPSVCTRGTGLTII